MYRWVAECFSPKMNLFYYVGSILRYPTLEMAKQDFAGYDEESWEWLLMARGFPLDTRPVKVRFLIPSA